MKAFRTVDDHKAEVIDYEIPAPAEDQILIEVKCVAINPTDWKHVEYMTPKDCGVGCDYAGIAAYDAHGFKKGDRLAGFTHGGAYKDRGAFAEYLVTDPKMVFRIPEGTSFEQAAAYPIPYLTACLALYQKLNLSGPQAGKKSDQFVLIYGGSSAVGIQAVQLASLSGYRVIATASPKNFDLLKSLGAEKCFDYKSSDVVDQIKEYTKSSLALALDTISEESSVKISSQALQKGGKLVLLLAAPKEVRDDIEIINVLAYTCLGKPLNYGPFNVPAIPSDVDFAVTWWKVLTQLLQEQKLVEAPLKVMEGGLNGIQEGFNYMKSGKVSAQKIVLNL